MHELIVEIANQESTMEFVSFNESTCLFARQKNRRFILVSNGSLADVVGTSCELRKYLEGLLRGNWNASWFFCVIKWEEWSPSQQQRWQNNDGRTHHFLHAWQAESTHWTGTGRIISRCRMLQARLVHLACWMNRDCQPSWLLVSSILNSG